MNQPQTKYLKDYSPPEFCVEEIDLSFQLFEDRAEVSTRAQYVKNPEIDQAASTLYLDGENLELLKIELDGKTLGAERYHADHEGLRVEKVPESFELFTRVLIEPQKNTSLEGLYRSKNMFCTQCEPQGFRKITYFPDRPDVMTRYKVRIEADQQKYPVLLSNGNQTGQGEAENGRHWVSYEDPFFKPSYLFALVAGDLKAHEDDFKTCSGKRVKLKIYVEEHHLDQCSHAMLSLKQAMKWDEDVFGLEYDLDQYLIVAVSDFNMGAMENKGLNIFNASYVMARPDTATDTAYENIQGVIGHEYFHNWTGNRVTCRDWFQLSLKEGLTIFRDQEFSADMNSKTLKRIDEVNLLRNHQFLEDAGPMAHPVRPESYIEINNFYTVTVYHKGAELIRMMDLIIGRENFLQGMMLYFKRHDGQAVTTEDFARAMEDASGEDLSQLKLWYSQAGTPRVSFSSEYDPTNQKLILHLKQSCPPTPGQKTKKSFHIPVKIGFLNSAGHSLPFALQRGKEPDKTQTLLKFDRTSQTFEFFGIEQRPVVSAFRHFSAPVILESDLSDQDLKTIMVHDSDDFNRWEASQKIHLKVLQSLIEALISNQTPSVDDDVLDSFFEILTKKSEDKALVSCLLALPSESYIGQQREVVEIDEIHQAREFLKTELGQRLYSAFETVYHDDLTNEPYCFDSVSAGKRRLKNLALGYLMAAKPQAASQVCFDQFQSADNMTDRLAALALLTEVEGEMTQTALDQFYEQWKDNDLVIDQWFALQAASKNTGLEKIRSLMKDPAYSVDNPNKIRSLVGVFCNRNLIRFHEKNGEGYRFLAKEIIRLDGLNPQIAARLATPFTRWKRYDETRQKLILTELRNMEKTKSLSRDLFEIVSKSLG